MPEAVPIQVGKVTSSETSSEPDFSSEVESEIESEVEPDSELEDVVLFTTFCLTVGKKSSFLCKADLVVTEEGRGRQVDWPLGAGEATVVFDSNMTSSEFFKKELNMYLYIYK